MARFFLSLGNAIDRLTEVMSHPDVHNNTFMRDAAIQRFEFTIELFWKILKKILFYEKIEATTPRDTLSKAYQYKFIDDEVVWLDMLDSGNNTSHAYKEEEAQIIFERIKSYMPVFEATYQKLKKTYDL
ncbi:nucleotidyltransferase substrate binding protein [bacterium]|nr:MAG: nucleotidyltransferase substrate binding protein [bacterium]